MQDLYENSVLVIVASCKKNLTNLRIKICQLREAVQFNGLVCLTAYFSFVDAIFPARTGTFDIGV